MNSIVKEKAELRKQREEVFKKMSAFQDVLRHYYQDFELSEFERSAVIGTYSSIRNFKEDYKTFDFVYDVEFYAFNLHHTAAEAIWRYRERFEYKMLPKINIIESSMKYFKETFAKYENK